MPEDIPLSLSGVKNHNTRLTINKSLLYGAVFGSEFSNSVDAAAPLDDALTKCTIYLLLVGPVLALLRISMCVHISAISCLAPFYNI